MKWDRRWLWLVGALAVIMGALAWGLPLATLLTVAAILACPAAMLFGMGMMGRTQEGGMACHAGTPGAMREEAPHAWPARPLGTVENGVGVAERPTDTVKVKPDGDPMLILKRRLAAGEITLEEYERLAAVIREAPAAAPSTDATDRRATHVAG